MPLVSRPRLVSFVRVLFLRELTFFVPSSPFFTRLSRRSSMLSTRSVWEPGKSPKRTQPSQFSRRSISPHLPDLLSCSRSCFLYSTIYNAIRVGYRLFDGACDYGNEKECGEGVARAIKDGLVKREDLCSSISLSLSLRSSSLLKLMVLSPWLFSHHIETMEHLPR